MGVTSTQVFTATITKLKKNDTLKDAQYLWDTEISWDITSYLSEQPSSKRIKITNVGKNVGKRETSYTVGGNVS